MAQKLRAETDKVLVFDRETAHGGFTRKPTLEPLIVPTGISNIVYGPHLYNAPYSCSQAEEQVERFKMWSEECDGIPVIMDEFAPSSQEEMDVFVSKFKESGFAWTY